MAVAPPTERRITSLDGLRGVAAVVVLLGHVWQVRIGYAAPVYRPGEFAELTWFRDAIITQSGPQAVIVFFLLSGIVLSMPVLHSTAFDWFNYFPRRLTRLYIPTLAALIFGVLLVALIPRDKSLATAGTWMANVNADSIDLGRIAREATLLMPASLYNGPLWSLTWEILFSLLLPLFVVLGVLVRRWWLVGLASCIALCAAGAGLGLDPVKYMPMFLIGTIIATRLDDIRDAADRILRRKYGWLVAVAAVLIAVLLLASRALVAPELFDARLVIALTEGAWVLGAAIIVVLAVTLPVFRLALDSRVAQWLGRLSFSLYLVHFPILATLTFTIGDTQWWLVALLAITLSFAVAWVFMRTIEAPSNILSRRIGRRTAAIAAQRFETVEQPSP